MYNFSHLNKGFTSFRFVCFSPLVSNSMCQSFLEFNYFKLIELLLLACSAYSPSFHVSCSINYNDNLTVPWLYLGDKRSINSKVMVFTFGTVERRLWIRELQSVSLSRSSVTGSPWDCSQNRNDPGAWLWGRSVLWITKRWQKYTI